MLWQFWVFLCFHINFLDRNLFKTVTFYYEGNFKSKIYFNFSISSFLNIRKHIHVEKGNLMKTEVCFNWDMYQVWITCHHWCSSVTKSCLSLCNPMDGSTSGPKGFFRQEYWSGLPFPSPGDLHKQGIKPTSLALAGRFFTTQPQGKPHESECLTLSFLVWPCVVITVLILEY